MTLKLKSDFRQHIRAWHKEQLGFSERLDAQAGFVAGLDQVLSDSRVLGQVGERRTVLLYAPLSDEPAFNAERRLRDQGFGVAYPRIENKSEALLSVRRVSLENPDDWAPLTDRSSFADLSQPGDWTPCLSAQEIGMVLVPALGFNLQGYRLGRGKGFYDRFLGQVPQAVKVGVVWAEWSMLPFDADSWDVPVDVVLTEQQWRWVK